MTSSAKKITITAQLFLLIFSSSLYAQNIISGQIIDSATKSPIPFSLIQLAIEKTTNVSNVEGNFNLNITNKSLNDTLVVSSLGYQTSRISAEKALKIKNLKIYLTPSAIILPEVTVKPIVVTELLNNAIRTSAAKFQSPIIIEGYYREVVKTDTSISKYADGLISYYLQRDKKNQTDVTTKIKQSRVKEIKLADEDKFDGLESKIPISKLAEFINPATANVLDSNNFKYYDYQLGEIYSPTNIYIIKFKPKPNINLALYEGVIQIDKASDLISGTDYRFSPTPNFRVIKSISMLGIKISLTNKRTIVKYKLENGNYYPAHIFVNGGLTIESKKLNQTNEFRSEFITTKYSAWNAEKPNEVFKRKYLFQNGNSYTSKFWELLNNNPNTAEELDFLKQ